LERKRRRAVTVNSLNMKMRMMVTAKKTTTRKASTNGAKKEMTGTGTTERIKRLMSVVIQCQIHLIPL
jgi:hypothetical protein